MKDNDDIINQMRGKFVQERSAMKKNYLRGLLVLIILLAAYNVIVFAFPFTRNGVFWTAYGFTAAAIDLQVVIFYLAFRRGESLKSKFYGFPIVKVGIIYLVIQVVAGFIFMAAAALIPVWATVIISVVLLATAGIGLITADAVRDVIEKQDAQLKQDTSFMRKIQLQADNMVNQCGEKKLMGAVKKFAENLRYSDPVSNAVLDSVEEELLVCINNLQKAIRENAYDEAFRICQEAERILKERNLLCKENKRQ